MTSVSVAAIVGALNGCIPVNASYIVTARLHRSIAGVTGCAMMASGDMYAGVPIK